MDITLIHSSSMTVAYLDMDAHAFLPEISHPNEEIVNVLEGEIRLSVGGESQKLVKGSVAVISPDVSHSGEAIVNSRLLAVFHPVRENYR